MSAPAPATGDLFDNRSRYQVALEGFGPKAVLQMLVAHSVITALGQGLGLWLPTTVGPQGGNFYPVWALIAVQAPLAAGAGHLFAQRRREAFWRVHTLLGLANFAWLGCLAWEAPGFYAALLLTLAATWAYHDAWITGGRGVRVLYLLAAPAVDLALLAVDAGGGRGLLWAFREAPAFAAAFLSMQVALTLLFQMLIRWVGDQVATADQRLLESTRREQELTLLRHERRVIEASAALLSTGLLASKFSHDLASPTTVLRLDADMLARLAGELPPSPGKAAIAEIADELGEVARQLADMTGGVARAVREREVLGAVEITDLVQGACDAARGSLAGHREAWPTVELALAPSEVWVSPGHRGSVANLLANAAQHGLGRTVHVSGRPVGEWFYVLAIRDHGVEGAERDEALARVEHRLHLEFDAGRPPQGRPRGYGVALGLAKLHLLRYNGALRVRVPAEGPGLEFLVVLPRVEPGAIPPETNTPESVE